jgi:hypothetical protein
MVADESALVLVLPNDNVDSIIAKVRKTGATHVQLLVPDGVPVLQASAGIERLRDSAANDQIELQVITSDEETLDAARLGHLTTIGVSGTRVAPPGANGGAIAQEELPPATAPRQPAAEPPDDEDLFAALDDLSETMSRAPRRDATPQEYDDAFAAELDSLNDLDFAAEPQPDTRSHQDEAYDAFAAELDAWSDFSADEPPASDAPTVSSRATPPPSEPAVPPRPRVRPEDIELTADEKQRAGDIRAGGGSRPRSETRPRRETRPPMEPAPSRRNVYDDEQDLYGSEAQPARRPGFIRFLPILLVLLLVVIVLFLLFFNRPAAGETDAGPLASLGALFGGETVVVTLPSPDAEGQPFSVPVPLIQPGAPASDTAVAAAPLSAPVEYSVTGEVLSEAPSPAGTASGTLTIFSDNTQPIQLPENTQFVGTNPEGQEVRFAINEPAVIPPSTISDLGAQVIIDRGQVEVGVTALAPGSASNIEANTISQIIIPGQPPIVVNAGGALRLQHQAIGGGSEQMVRIVRDEDVQRVLGEALVGLNNQAPSVLQAQAEQQGLALEESTITPRGNAIPEAASYTVAVDPPRGTQVDPAAPNFTVTVSALFQALATPPGNPLESQLQPVAPNLLANRSGVPPGMAIGITDWQWSGEQLTVEGVMRRVDTTLDAGTRLAILNAVKGKPRAEAQAALDNFVQQGVIAGYELPEVEQLPQRSHQLTLEVQQPTQDT